MHLTKMHGLGNDYLYINCIEKKPEHLPELAIQLSDRHFGVGSDGLICVLPGDKGDFTMEMYNADGSRGAMCGNGIRCFGKYVYERGLTRKTCLSIDTDAGQRQLELRVRGGKVEQVRVDMGIPRVLKAVELLVEGKQRFLHPVDVGNPHAVCFCEPLEQIPLERLGPVLEVHPALPQRSNVEFVWLPSPERLKIQVWERGSGVTLACGTGACAALAAGVSSGRCERAVTAHLPGGELELQWSRDTNHIYMTGGATEVFECELSEDYAS